MLIAHLSDLHITKISSTPRINAEKIISNINEFEELPDFVIITGDLVDKNEPDYESCFEVLNKLKMPYYVIGGNNDRVSDLVLALEKYYPNHPKSEIENYLQYEVEIGDVSLIGVDFYGNRREGCENDFFRLDWLENKLKQDKKFLVMLHRYPLVSHLSYFTLDENIWLKRFADIIARYNTKVKLVASGHLHNSLFGNINGVPAISTFSSCNQLNLDFQKKQPKLKETTLLAFHVHRFDNENVTSYTVTV